MKYIINVWINFIDVTSLLSIDFNRNIKQLDDGLEITHSGDFSFILSPWTLVEGI